MAAEAALGDLAVRRAVEGQAHVLQVVDRLDGLAAHDLDGVLVGQVVAALDGVEHVPLPVVLLEVAERRADAALGGAGVRAGRVELAEDGDVGLAGHLHGGHQARAAGPDDHGVKLVVHPRLLQLGGYDRLERDDDLGPDHQEYDRPRLGEHRQGPPAWGVDVVVRDYPHPIHSVDEP